MTEINEIDPLSRDLLTMIHNLEVLERNQPKKENYFHQNESKPNSKRNYSESFSQSTEP